MNRNNKRKKTKTTRSTYKLSTQSMEATREENSIGELGVVRSKHRREGKDGM